MEFNSAFKGLSETELFKFSEFKIAMKYIYGWKKKCNNDCVDSSRQGCRTFPKMCKSYIKILDAKILTRNSFCTQDLQILGVTVIKFIRHEGLVRGISLSLTLVFHLF